jgi:hypothetical protein
MTVEKKPAPFNIVRHRGMQDRAQLPDGTWVEKQDKIWFDMVSGFVPVAPYDDHFLYELPVKYKGASVRCTCGSFAVVAGYSAYKGDASQQGLLYVCYQHSNFGTHLGGNAKWV